MNQFLIEVDDEQAQEIRKCMNAGDSFWLSGFDETEVAVTLDLEVFPEEVTYP